MVRRIIVGLFVLMLVAGTAAGEGEKTAAAGKAPIKKSKPAVDLEKMQQRVERNILLVERQLKSLEERLPNYPDGDVRRLAEEMKQTLMDRLAALKAQGDAIVAGNSEEASRLQRNLRRHNVFYEMRQALRLNDENTRLQAQMERFADDPDRTDAIKRIMAINIEMAGLLTKAADMRQQKDAIQEELGQKLKDARAKAQAAKGNAGGKPGKKAAPAEK